MFPPGLQRAIATTVLIFEPNRAYSLRRMRSGKLEAAARIAGRDLPLCALRKPQKSQAAAAVKVFIRSMP